MCNKLGHCWSKLARCEQRCKMFTLIVISIVVAFVFSGGILLAEAIVLRVRGR